MVASARCGSAMRIATWNVNALPPTHRNIVLDQRYQTLPGFLSALGDICCLQVRVCCSRQWEQCLAAYAVRWWARSTHAHIHMLQLLLLLPLRLRLRLRLLPL